VKEVVHGRALELLCRARWVLDAALAWEIASTVFEDAREHGGFLVGFEAFGWDLAAAA
jgi:hypothetical protein